MACGGGMNGMDWQPLQRYVPPGLTSVKFAAEEMDKRPEFVDGERLRFMYPCGICNQIVLQAQQTPCANRVCWNCIEERFGSRDIIRPCPLPHADMDDDEEYDCKDGLRRYHILKDVAAMKDLSRAKVYCDNRAYGCGAIMAWKNLKEHVENCPYKPLKCYSEGCHALFAPDNEAQHMTLCRYIRINCEFCGAAITRGSLEEHLEDCDKAVQNCPGCERTFSNMRELSNHCKISADCLADDCRDCAICDKSFTSTSELQRHLQSSTKYHFEIIAAKTLSADIRVYQKQQDKKIGEATARVDEPILRTVAESSMEVRQLRREVTNSTKASDTLDSALKAIQHASQQIQSIKARIEATDRQISHSGLQQPEAYNSLRTKTKEIETQTKDYQHRVTNLELATYDGVLIWKIADYERKTSEAAKGRGISMYSQPFYTSPMGYKMCTRVYLNGDGIGRNQYLSIFFVVMKGGYDDLLQWPFQQKVIFQLLHPKRGGHKEESFMPGAASTSFQNPESGLNIASGSSNMPKFRIYIKNKA